MAFSKKFPENSSSAYNMIAYGYAYGEYGEEPDYGAAYEAIDKSMELHLDLMQWTLNLKLLQWKVNIKKLLHNQLKAVDYAFFASPYQTKYSYLLEIS